MNIEDRIRQDPFLSVAINTTGISNREIGRQFDIDESVVRRWRNRNIVSPQASTHKPLTQEAGTSQWVAGIDLSTDRGEARTLPAPVVDGAKPVEDKELLEKVGVDPAKWEIASRKESRWQNAGGEWLSAHKVEVRRRGSMTGDLSVEQMTEILSDYSKRADRYFGSPTHANGIFVVPISDLQAGKVDGGGTAALVDRFGRMIQAVRDRLIREGSAQTLIIPVLGDCIEGLVSQGGKLVTRLDISVTEQVRVYRRLLIHAVAELAPHAKRVLVVVLPGNHDETYRVVSTPTHDSWAIEGASAAQEALAMSKNFKHVEFLYPDSEELVVTVNVGTKDKPFVLAFTHGHLAKAPNSMAAWWAGQSFGREHGGSADILFTGHFHHLRAEQMGGGRTWIQVPAMDGGSDWYRRSTGANQVAGILSLWVTPGKGLGWEGMTIHTGE